MTTPDLKNYGGAGVLIVDTNTSSFLLVHDYTQDYNCCGGLVKYHLNDPQYIEKTAREELYEETRTLISCDLDRLVASPFVDLDFQNQIFRCYILKMRCEADICEQFEKFNVNELPDDGEDFFETTSIAFFSLRQFQQRKSFSKIERTSMATSRDKKKYPLNQRVISVIRAAMKENLL